MRRLHPALPIIAVAVLAVIGIGAVAIQQGVVSPLRYFPETGHLLREPFLSYFDQNGGVATFGVPLTDAYDSAEGALVQTFQRAQLQLTVRGVELAPIGRALRLGDGAAGYQVADEFAAFYQAQGGDAFFGPPLDDARQQGGQLVQDFERARLIIDAQGGVRLADLGLAYLAVVPPPSDSGQAEFHLEGTPTPPPAVRASVSVQQPTVGQGGQQTIYVVVEDERGEPIAGAQSLAVLRYGAATAEVELPLTDANGLASARFIVPPAPSGSRVIVQMHVLVGEVFMTVETAYFQWW